MAAWGKQHREKVVKEMTAKVAPIYKPPTNARSLDVI